MSADYVVPHLTLKTSVGLTNQPKVDLAATTGYKDIVFGGEATYDSAKGDVTKWAAGAGELRLFHFNTWYCFSATAFLLLHDFALPDELLQGICEMTYTCIQMLNVIQSVISYLL